MKYFVIFILLTIITSSCTTDSNSTARYYFKDNTRVSFGKMLKGEQIGYWYYLKEDGNVYAHGNFSDGKPNGKWTFNFHSGRIVEFNLSGYEVDGYVVEYNCYGDTLNTSFYERGTRKNVWIKKGSNLDEIIEAYHTSEGTNLSITKFDEITLPFIY